MGGDDVSPALRVELGSGVYTLKVFYDGDPVARETVQLSRAADVLADLPRLLSRHGGCERIAVLVDSVQLFAVDCRGERIAD